MHISGESLLVIIVVGVIAGWLAGQIVQGTGFGLVGDFIIGVVGAFIGSWLLPQLGVHIGAGMVAAIANATIGAILCWSCSGQSEAQAATVAEVGGRANIAHCAARADMAWRAILTRLTARRMGSFLLKLPAKVRYICGCVSHGRRERLGRPSTQAWQARREARPMAVKATPSFDAKAFLGKVGEGRSREQPRCASWQSR